MASIEKGEVGKRRKLGGRIENKKGVGEVWKGKGMRGGSVEREGLREGEGVVITA